MSTLQAPTVIRTDHNFIRTFSGTRFWPLAPKAEDVKLEDIAHALSLVCRWTGHTYGFYSVAEHSLRVSMEAERMILARGASFELAWDVALWGLLHDATEAYICDLAGPLKGSTALADLYKSYEARLMGAIAKRFDLMPHMPAVVKEADHIMLATEARDLMGVPEDEAERWGFGGVTPLKRTIYPMDIERVKAGFMQRFEYLKIARDAVRKPKGGGL